MKRFKCRDAGMNCDYVAEGNTDDEVMQKAREHGKSAHGMQQLSPDMEKNVRQQIKNV